MLHDFRITSLLFCLTAVLVLAGCAGHRTDGSGDAISDREVELRLDLAEAYLRNNEPRLALQELNLIEAQARTLPRYHFSLGYARLLMGNAAEAAAALRKAVELAPDHGEAWNNLGLALLSLGDLDGAEAAFGSALAVPAYRTPEVAALNLAQLYLDRDQPVPALRYVNLALELNWRFTNAYLLAAEIHLIQGNADQAVQLLRRGAEGNLDDPRILLTLVEYLLIAGQPDQARPWLKQLLETAPPGSREAARAKEYQQALDDWRVSFMGREGLILEQSIAEEPTVAEPEEQDPAREQPRSALPAPEDSALNAQKQADASWESAYLVQIGAFLSADRAAKMRADYQAKGHAAGIYQVQRKGKTWHLVYIAAEQTREEAEEAARRFRADEDRATYIVRVGRGRYLD